MTPEEILQGLYDETLVGNAPRVLELTVYPALVALNAIPKIAIAPLLVIWMGFGAGRFELAGRGCHETERETVGGGWCCCGLVDADGRGGFGAGDPGVEDGRRLRL